VKDYIYILKEANSFQSLIWNPGVGGAHGFFYADVDKTTLRLCMKRQGVLLFRVSVGASYLVRRGLRFLGGFVCFLIIQVQVGVVFVFLFFYFFKAGAT
jgi:hypothetical protein